MVHAPGTHPPRDSAVARIPPISPPNHAAPPGCDTRPATGLSYLPIDPLRGAVCLGVVVLHMYASLSGPLRELFGPGFEFALTYFRLGVESFLLLGGFFVAHMLRPSVANFVSVPRLFARRFLRLAVPYWIAIGLVLLGELVKRAWFGKNNLPSWSDALATVAFLQDLLGEPMGVLYPLWSMAPLFQYFVLSMGLYWVTRRAMLWIDPAEFQTRTRQVMIVVCLVVAGVGPSEFTSSWQLPRWGCVLALGSLAYWYAARTLAWWAFAPVLAWFLGVALADGDVGRVKAAAAAVLLVALGRGLKIPDSALTRGLAWVGHRSYSIYLIHGFVGHRVISASLYASPDLRSDPWVCFGLFSAALVVSLVAGAVFYRFVERPVARTASGIEYRR